MLLTVAIPTYNRDQKLRATLLNVAAQIERHRLSDVEIVVSDNCSPDRTGQVCADVAAEHPTVAIRYFRKEANVGFDRNVDALFGHALGQYVWTFSDDDRPGPDALATVVGLLRQREVRFAFVNYEVSVDGKPMASRFGVGENRWLEARDLLKAIRFSNSLVSSCIYRRQAWLDAGAHQYVGTLWVHFFMARAVLCQGLGLIVGAPLFTMVQSSLEKSRAEQRKEDSDQIEFFLQAHLKFVQYAREMAHYGYDHETCALAESLGRREDLYQVINYKLTAPRYSPKQIWSTWKGFARYRAPQFRFWCVTTPLLFAPNAVVRLLRTASRKVNAWRS